MDPVSALGIASAIVQFVTFASQLISATADIYDSTIDGSAYTSSLNTSYSQLKRLCQNLNQASQKVSRDQATTSSQATTTDECHAAPTFNSFTQGGRTDALDNTSEVELRMGNTLPELQHVYSTLQDVVKSCEQDSAIILSLLSKLKLERCVGSLTKSFKVAVKIIWKKDEIQKVDERLKRSQSILIATMARISNIYHIQHSQELVTLRRESQLLGARYSEQLSDMQNTLRNIEKGKAFAPTAEEFKGEIDTLEKMMRQSSLSEARIRKELDIIRSLSSKTRQFRYNAICDAHHETFRWVFTPPSDQETNLSSKQREAQTKLLKWLENGSGVFWVSGKPGSGKSTFMKFVADHKRTVEALSRWAHPSRAIVSSCYFWSSGSRMQKSLAGLLQTLLHDVFRFCPQLIQNVCPSRWSGEVLNGEKWTESELRATLSRISEQPDRTFRFCFFIDGLDEYDSAGGDHSDFCEYLTTISSRDIKVCLSSRPWNEFNDAFGQDPSSRTFIHELTWDDILLYTQSRLHRHPRWKSLESQTKRAGCLARTVVARAQGVFLWVFLVTRLLREGLTNDDSFTDLEKRLLSLPTELETFFKQILESVPSFYHEKMAGALQVALYAKEPLDSMIYCFIGDEYEDPDYFQHPLDVENDMSLGDHQVQLRLRQEQIVRRLRGWCRGLLEEQLGKIEFLHRTVGEFLRTKEMSDFLDSKRPKYFNTGLSILKAYVAWLQPSNLEDGNFMLFEEKGLKNLAFCETPLYQGVRTALSYASDLEMVDEVPKTALDSLINEMDLRLADMAKAIKPTLLWHHLETPEHVSGLIRLIALDLPLMGYLSRRLVAEPSFLSIFSQSPISVVLWTPSLPHTTWPKETRQKLEYVLKAGSNPNELTVGSMHMITIWEKFLSEVLPKGPPMRWTKAGTKFQDAIEEGLVQVFLDFGANTQARIWSGSGGAAPAFTLFVAAAFDMEWNDLAEEMYFKALDSFIKGGATFDSGENSRNESQPSGLDQTLVEFSTIDLAEFDSFTSATGPEPAEGHHEVIFSRLKARLDLVDSLDQKPQRLFLAKLLKKILVCAHKASWPLDKYQHLIDRALSDKEPPPGDCDLSLCLKRSGTHDFDEYRRRTKRRL
ncbi:nacht nucleoside triphosphatase [Fusarium beomiforme]|uniref:Nacht nucleoside triphosphatase n=1 Tax=Fusarium beomiforme TaxID=44412 RepID=A0A9P5DWD2_9HYPO|nr:nacht nucleoside triphosphatase [Fusarium beomiforme]